MPIRILIVDDNEIVRRGVEALISSWAGWQVCGHASEGTEAVQKAVELCPDIVLLYISMPGPSGLEVTRQLRTELPHSKIVIMSHHDPTLLLPRALEAGAHACIDKGRLGVDLLSALQTVTGTF